GRTLPPNGTSISSAPGTSNGSRPTGMRPTRGESESAMRYRRSNLPTEDAAPVAGAQPAAKATFRVPGRGTHPRSVAQPTASAVRPGVPTAAVPTPPAAQSAVPTAAAPAATAAPAAPADPELLTGLVDVVAITEVTHDVTTFELRAAWMTCVDFEPGQYVTMRVPELGLERCAPRPPAPHGTNTCTIAGKRAAGGAVSNHPPRAVAAGGRLHADRPYDLFSPSEHPAEKPLFLPAASGITPIMSLVRFPL